jgi:type VI secretion system protein ImpI
MELPFISQFHLVIELQNDRLWVRDLGSTNGTQLKNVGRAPTNQPVDLMACGFEFSIVSLDFSVFSAPLDMVQVPQASQRPRLGVTSFLDASKLPSLQPGEPNIANETRPLYAAYRSAWSELIRSVDVEVSKLPAAKRSAALEQLSREFDALRREPDFDGLCARQGARAGESQSGAPPGHRLESVALEGVRELAFDFCATAGPLESVDSLVRFVERMQHVLDVFFRAFVSLRDGQRQFETDMALRRPGGQSPCSAELAQSPGDLSQALLDWRQPETDGVAYVESTLADFMIHQVALLNGVMTGVRTLLVEFSPTRIEERAQDTRFNPDGVGMGPLRYKSLWRTLERVHADFTGEDKQVFSVLFGKQFAKAYETQFGSSIRTTHRSTEGRPRATIPPINGEGPQRR